MLSYIIGYTISRVRLSPHFHTRQTDTDLLSYSYWLWNSNQMLIRFTGSIAIDEMSCLTYNPIHHRNLKKELFYAWMTYLVQVQGLYHNYNHSSSFVFCDFGRMLFKSLSHFSGDIATVESSRGDPTRGKTMSL